MIDTRIRPEQNGAASPEDRNTMKAIVQDTYGSTDVLRLEDIGKPVPKDGEVLTRVHATQACGT